MVPHRSFRFSPRVPRGAPISSGFFPSPLARGLRPRNKRSGVCVAKVSSLSLGDTKGQKLHSSLPLFSPSRSARARPNTEQGLTDGLVFPRGCSRRNANGRRPFSFTSGYVGGGRPRAGPRLIPQSPTRGHPSAAGGRWVSPPPFSLSNTCIGEARGCFFRDFSLPGPFSLFSLHILLSQRSTPDDSAQPSRHGSLGERHGDARPPLPFFFGAPFPLLDMYTDARFPVPRCRAAVGKGEA